MALNNDQLKVVQSISAGDNIFLTGKGGTGKSYVTNYVRQNTKNVVVCAPTGIAALNVDGVTVHSAFKIPIGIVERGTYFRPNGKSKKYEILCTSNLIIIDEISMCRIDVFEYIARTLISLPNKPQILVVGDFYQLPPVLASLKGSDKDEEVAFRKIYGDKLYAFESPLWKKLNLKTIELTQSMRQDDLDFIKALDALREGDKSCLDLFSTRVCGKEDSRYATLCGTNKEATQINHKMLMELVSDDNPLISLNAQITGNVSEREYPTQSELNLCVGAKIMILANDKEKQYVNGSMGTVARYDECLQTITIELEDGPVVVIERYDWSFYDYEVKEDRNGNKTIMQITRGKFSQFPIKLSWAISIHKSQGQTYDHININIKSIFAEGQLYVALSRCRTLAGLNIIGSLTPDKILVSKSVQQFMNGETPDDDINDVQQIDQDKDRYQEGYDDGYKDGAAITEAQYKEKIQSDPGVKVLSDYTKRENEKKLLTPEQRNPKGAGRKRMQDSDKWKTKAIRVPDALADALLRLSALAKQHPETIPDMIKSIEDAISKQADTTHDSDSASSYELTVLEQLDSQYERGNPQINIF